MSKQNETVVLLNTLIRVKIAPSEIHGVGVFAMRDIPKNTKLYAEMTPQVFKLPYEDMDNLFPEIKQMLLERWPQIINGSAFAFPTERIQAYMNHSEEPNYDAVNDIMLKDIERGEEVTEDYRLIPNYEKVHKWLVSEKEKSVV